MRMVPQLVRRGKQDRRMGEPSDQDWEVGWLRSAFSSASGSRMSPRIRLTASLPNAPRRLPSLTSRE